MPGRFTEQIPEDIDKGTWSQRLGHRIKLWMMSAEESLGGLQGTPDVPSQIQAGESADTGVSQAPAPSDHTHDVLTAAPSVKVAYDQPPDEGSGSALMRADARLRLDDGVNIGDLLIWDGSDWVSSPAPSGSVNQVRVSVDFGAGYTDKAQTVVTGEAWVTALSCLAAAVLTPAGVDPDDMYLLDFRVVISDLVVGDGFTITVYSPPTATGVYEVMVIGG